MRQLSIIYRACSKELNVSEFNQSRPIWFDKKKCWRSFFDNFGVNKNVRIVVVFDGDKDNDLSQYIKRDNINEIIYLNNVGNKESLIYCYNLAKTIECDYFCLFEDDYLWLPDSYKILIEGLDRFGNFGLISLYHHPDRIFRNDDITLGHEYILATNSCYWRTAESNTATFGTSKKLFDKYFQEFIDCNIHDRLLFTNLIKKYNMRHFTPVSDRYGCTHVNQFFFSLYFNWLEFNNDIKT